MAIRISESTEPGRFKSKHWVNSFTSDNKILVTLTGIVLTDFKGEGGNWKEEDIIISTKFPYHFFPKGKALNVEQWAPFITINAIYNADHAVYAGWVVNEFKMAPSQAEKIYNYGEETSISLLAKVAVRDVDGYLYRVGYSVTVKGIFVDDDREPIP